MRAGSKINIRANSPAHSAPESERNQGRYNAVTIIPLYRLIKTESPLYTNCICFSRSRLAPCSLFLFITRYIPRICVKRANKRWRNIIQKKRVRNIAPRARLGFNYAFPYASIYNLATLGQFYRTYRLAQFKSTPYSDITQHRNRIIVTLCTHSDEEAVYFRKRVDRSANSLVKDLIFVSYTTHLVV